MGNKKYYIVFVIIISLVLELISSPEIRGDLHKPDRQELNIKLCNKIYKSYIRQHKDETDEYWNPNVELDDFYFLWHPYRVIAKYISIDSIIPTEKRNFYVANYDTTPGDPFYRLSGFSQLKLTEIPLESKGYICIKESLYSSFLNTCCNNDTIISIRTFIDLSPFPIGKLREQVAYISNCDSVLETENGVSKNTDIIHSSTKLYNAIRKWDIHKVSQLINGEDVFIGKSSTLFFSRAIYRDEKLAEYCAYFSLYHTCFDDEDDYDW